MCDGHTRRPATWFHQIRRPSFSTTHATERSNRVFVHIVCVKDDKSGSEITLVLACLQENAKVGTKKWWPKCLFEIRLTQYSQLSLNGHLYETDTPIRRTPGAGPGRYNQTLCKTDTSIKWTTDTLKWSTDTCEVLNVAATLRFREEKLLND